MGALVFGSGTGRTGKTVVAESLENKGWLRHKSPTRAFFQSKKISGEADLFSRPQPERAQIQRDYYEFFLEDLDTFTSRLVAEGNSDKNVIFERSPIDNFSYLMFHDWDMKRDEHEAYIERISQFFERKVTEGWLNILVLFPFPTEWMRTEDPDKFRHSMFGKDMTIHALVDYNALLMYDAIPNEISLCYLEAESSVEERVHHIEEFISMTAVYKATR